MPLYHLGPTPKRALRAIVAYFPGIDKSTLAACLARHKMLGIWGQDYRMPEAGYERLVRSLLPGGFVPSGVPFTIAVDNSIANEVLHANPPALVGCEFLTSHAHVAGADI